jgi:short-chain Z-isoprenyl diphosphate synthase
VGFRDLIYRAYTSSIQAELHRIATPGHIGVILDGNRRWAKAYGASSSAGHQAGADKVLEFLGWCREVDVKVVTLWLLSTDNLARPEVELRPLLAIISDLVERLAETGIYRVHPVGTLDLLPAEAAQRIKRACGETDHLDAMTVNVAIGYGGRQEIADAVRSLLQEHAAAGTSIEQVAEILDVEHISAHMYTKGQPDPDLVIRTSGEQRLSGFLLWQSAHSEFYFCEAFWPEFRKVDFLRALRAYSRRERRYGV